MVIIDNAAQAKIVFTKEESYTVDTQEDLMRVIEIIKHDEIMKKYLL